MARKPLRSQLNQIRAWVRQGRTDAWIAHQLDIPASELREFRRRHELAPEEETGEVELRDEIEAEIEATLDEEEPAEEEPAEDADSEEAGPDAEDADSEEVGPDGEDGTADGEAGTGRRRRRRRRRRSGGGRGGEAAIEATFEHGGEEGFGLWLDPAVEDNPVYAEHWAGHRQIAVTIEADRIVIRRA